ncbi:ABC transporter substrate-binding protein [bacterium]|nr:ABC transporter substrate-binding protein [bacterium]
MKLCRLLQKCHSESFSYAQDEESRVSNGDSSLRNASFRMTKTLVCMLAILFTLTNSILFADGRIVSLKPNITDILLAIKADGDIVGITSYCQWNSEKTRPTIVADYTNIEIERVIALKPDLIISSRENSDQKDISTLKNMGIKALLLDFNSIGSTLASIRTLGEKLDRKKEAQALLNRFSILLNGYKNSKRETKVLLVLGQKPLIVAGPKSFLGEAIEAAGAYNAVGSTSVKYPNFSTEMLIGANPGIIIDMSMGSENRKLWQHRLNWWNQFTTINAVRDNKIFQLDINDFRPSNKLLVGLNKLNSIIGMKKP